DRQKAVGPNRARPAEPGAVQHGRPEQGVEVEDVLADEVVHLGGRAGPAEAVEIDPLTVAQVAKAGEIADRRVQPDVEVLVGLARNEETEVRGVTGDVPVAQARVEPLLELVLNLALYVSSRRPLAQHVGEIVEPDEVVLGFAVLGRYPGDRRTG